MNVKNFFPLFIIFVLVCISCQQKELPKGEGKKDSSIPTHISYSITLQLVDSTTVRSVVKGDKAEVYESKMITILTGNVQLFLYKPFTSTVETVLKCDSAVIFDNTKDMNAYGNVDVTSYTSKTNVKTPLLRWVQLTQRFTSDKSVLIDSPSETISGIGFESDKELVNYTIYKVNGRTK
jgi:LPS export ABC transporter protein LptC